jgi:hypothetical protein
MKNLLLAFLLLQDGWTELVGNKGLEAWKPANGWTVAGDVSVDEADPKKLVLKAGTGPSPTATRRARTSSPSRSSATSSCTSSSRSRRARTRAST